MRLRTLFTTLMISAGLVLGISGCGAADDTAAAENTAEQDSDDGSGTEGDSDPYITGGDISPFYTDPSQAESTVSDNASDADTDPEIAAESAELEDKVQSIVSGDAEESQTPVRSESDLYVATYGSDDNDGSSEAPFATIQKALDTVTPGHTIYIRSGIYKGKNKFTASGTESAPIIITHAPDCNASSVMISLASGQEGAIFDANGQSYVQLIDLRIGNSMANWVYGVYIPKGSHDIRIEETEFIDMTAPTTGGAYAVLAYGDGSTEDTAIHDIYVYDNEVHNIITGQGVGMAASGNVDSITFDGNLLYSVTGIGIDLYGGGRTSFDDELDQPRNCIVQGNEVYQCQSLFDEANAGILIDGAKDTTVQDNYVYECPIGIEIASENYNYDYTTQNILVTGNTVHNNHDTGISVGGCNANYYGTVTNSEISGNILYNNGYYANDGCNGEIHFEKCDGIIVQDNIVRNHDYSYPVIGCGKTSEYVKNVTFNNNLYAYDKPEKIVFRFQGNVYVGLDAWNEFTGGSDVNTSGSSSGS